MDTDKRKNILAASCALVAVKRNVQRQDGRGLLDRISTFMFLFLFFYVLLTVHLSIILGVNQLNAQNLFIISLLYASTCFEHYVPIIRRSKLYYTASGIVTFCR